MVTTYGGFFFCTILKLAASKPTGDSHLSGERECNHLTKQSDAIFDVRQLSSADGEERSAGHTVLPIGEYKSVPFCSERILQHPGKLHYRIPVSIIVEMIFAFFFSFLSSPKTSGKRRKNSAFPMTLWALVR